MKPNILRRSFSARLSFFILLFTTVIFMAAFGVFYHFSSGIIERNARKEAESAFQIVNLQIEKVLWRVESVPDNLKRIIASGRILPDSMYNITHDVIHNNPDIYGCAIAFEPYYFPEKGYYFSPYSYRDGDTIRNLQLGNKEYDYFNWAWYSEPLKSGCPCWSEPYYDKGGGQMMMCTYSSPIYDANGAVTGVFTSDISLEWLTDLLDDMKRNDQSYAFMLGKDGTYIVHPSRERILNATIFDVGEEMNNPQVKQIGKRMIAGEQGMQLLNNDGVQSYIFYAPVPHTQWSLGIVLPGREVFKDLRHFNWIFLLAAGLGLCALFLLSIRTVSSLSKPLKRFASSAREIADGNFNVPLPAIRSKDEMKELFDSFSYMQSELNNYIANLKQTMSAKEKIESELRIARDIQMSMLPKVFPPFPNHNRLDLFAVLNPAKEVGGDLYDFFMKDDRLYFAIGDVSGKGVPASLLMAVTLTLFRSVAANMESSAAVIKSLNASLSDNNPSNMFITMLSGSLDLNTGLLRYCNAGHNPPVVITPDGACTWLETVPNLPIGVTKEFPFEEQCLTLSDNSSLILYTDGITEAENTQKELYGKDRLLDTIRKNSKLAPVAMIETLLSDISNFVNDCDPSDDITLMIMEYKLRTLFSETSKLVIFNRIEELNKLSVFIEQTGERLNLTPELTMNLNLALEEAIANIIQHGKQKTTNELIEIIFSHNNDKLTFTITDNGEAFDPTDIADTDITLSAEERPIGKLGIFLIKRIMNEVTYRRENGKNILTLTKYYHLNK